MTNAQTQVEKAIHAAYDIDLFNAIFFFNDLKTRRGTFCHLQTMDKVTFDKYVKKLAVYARKRMAAVLGPSLFGPSQLDEGAAKDVYFLYKHHYNALCNYVSSL